MAGQLVDYGYDVIVDAGGSQAADCWLLNSCTVKSPTQAVLASLIQAGRALRKPMIVSGCVPQADRRAPELEGLSLLGARARGVWEHGVRV